MAALNFVDRYSTTLASGYTSGGTTLSVTSASGLPSGDCNFFLIVKAEGANTEEVFAVSNVSGTTLTVAGAQAGTSASNHASGADVIGSIMTASAFGQVGGLVLLDSRTASSSAELDFTSKITSAFDEYQIEIVQLVPSNSGVSILLQFSVNNGSSYDTGSNYAWVGSRQSNGGSAPAGSNATTSFGLDCSGGVVNTASHGGIITTIKLMMSSPGSVRPRVWWWGGIDDGTANLVILTYAQGQYLSTTAVTAFRILASAGNLATGTVRLYGVSKGA